MTTVYKYANPLNPKEYLLLYPTAYGKYFQQYSVQQQSQIKG